MDIYRKKSAKWIEGNAKWSYAYGANVTAHELKVKWVVNEQDAIDILTTISFLHKQLDECFVVPQHII